MKAYHIALGFLLVLCSFYSCEKADDRYVHTDTSITSIYIRDNVGGVYVEGTFEDENTIVFKIPLASSNEIDNKNVLIYANIPVSACVTPGFAGRHDLSSPKEFTVTNDNGVPCVYTLQAIYLDF
jgi:hypothetical protein